MPLPYPLPQPPQPKPGTPPGPWDPPEPPGDPKPRRVTVHPQHMPAPLKLKASGMYKGMLSWWPLDGQSRPSSPVLPVMFR